MLHQPHHQLFLLRQAFGHQKRQRNQRIVIDELLHGTRPQQRDQKCGRAFISLGQRVFFDNEIQLMRGAAGYIRIKPFAAKTLLNRGQAGSQPVSAQLPE